MDRPEFSRYLSHMRINEGRNVQHIVLDYFQRPERVMNQILVNPDISENPAGAPGGVFVFSIS